MNALGVSPISSGFYLALGFGTETEFITFLNNEEIFRSLKL
jgi:hypothetical protein